MNTIGLARLVGLSTALLLLALSGCSQSHGPADARPFACSADLDRWASHHLDAGGDYRSGVAALSDLPWIAMRKTEGNVLLAALGVDETGIAFRERFELPGSPVFPRALDVDIARRHAVLLTTRTPSGLPPSVEVWWIDLEAADVRRARWSSLALPADTSALALSVAFVGERIVLAASYEHGERVGQGGARIEILDDKLDPLDAVQLTDESVAHHMVRVAPGEVHVYDRHAPTSHDYRIMPTGIEELSPEDVHLEFLDKVLGGMHDYLVLVRPAEIRVRGSTRTWAAKWPSGLIRGPAVLRLHKVGGAFALQTFPEGWTEDPTPVIGYTRGDALRWLRIERSAGAAGTGGFPLMPVIEDTRLGLFYLEAQSAHPEQPLRYFGLECPDGG